MEESKNIFLYHLDHELQPLFSLDKYSRKIVYDAFFNIAKLAYLLCEGQIIVPISNYMESDIGHEVIDSLCSNYNIESDFLVFASSSYNIDELAEKKKIEHGDYYPELGKHYEDVLLGKSMLPGKMIKRARSASVDIECAWKRPEEIIKLSKTIYAKYPNIYKAGELEQLVGDVPKKLGARAYISKYITPLFKRVKNNKAGLDNEINRFITQEYIKSFLDEWNAVCINDIPLIDANCILPSDKEYCHVSYKRCMEKLYRAQYKRKRADLFLKECHIEELYEFKYSKVWQDIVYQEKVEELVKAGKCIFLNGGLHIVGNVENKSDYDEIQKVDIGIITALTKECAAVLEVLGDTKKVINNKKNRNDYFYIGKVKGAADKMHYVAVMLAGENNNLSAIACTSMINFFPNVSTIIMCGIAAGIPNENEPDKGIHLGDVIVADKVIQYDYGKETKEGFVLKSIPTKCTVRLQKACKDIEIQFLTKTNDINPFIENHALGDYERPSATTDKWRTQSDKSSEMVKVYSGTIASGNLVVKKTELREELRTKYNAKAIEMEGSGIADAAENSDVGFIVVRGVCDYGDETKDDTWQKYAALSAASYTYLLIENLPVSE